MILITNLEINYFILISGIKIGFKNLFSDKFYNIQLDISKTGIMERGYKQVHTMLAS